MTDQTMEQTPDHATPQSTAQASAQAQTATSPVEATPAAEESSFEDSREAGPPAWFKTAVFYEVLVRSFKDSNGDGTGDFKGLTKKLDYLQWLGVDCLWLPPFFPSPLRDGGYDVADYTGVLPLVGTVEDFQVFLDAAHERGIKVIIDFVANHTSDAHPWFQASRSDPDGPYGDFYVWSDTDEKYQDARIIFVDTEPSNWTWDPVRQQYFWHRFFSHQPDLNYENPQVHEAVLDALRFWLDMGLDGFRLDAVPYLYVREGTNGENLPETHEFLKKVRRVVDEEYPGRILLAEANQWPADVVDYFGDFASGGDECHMCFHFPVMPRIFMAVRRESRFPISEILEQTPPIPSGCQWGIFLRNHDELTLEMVTDEDRDYMWAEYAKDPRMKANIGIRRRLAPLLDNDVNQMELFTALLLSLPGSPVLYYGDEIGMGDNIWLGDRDAVRTPMQWSGDRNAGFSTANPGKLDRPLVMDPVYGYQAVNVEAQTEDPSSLLQWTRRMIHARKQHPAFGLGSFHDLGGSNPSVLSYSREHTFPDGTTEIMICVNNLSRFPQPVELDLRRFEGMVPVEVIGRVPFPPIGELPYLLTLGGYGFYWFRLTQPVESSASGATAEEGALL
ncbi:maltose alpha-D-glucosyltransferase [Nocardioides sp. DS6]|uniref:maltose alpha-D-glucosyltransferase n=2 Tax=Nocardioides eburneus TaxID=3231482 RepID=A0ABV3T3J9_9ACTN